MKFDMHCHTKEGSVDARVSIEDYIKTLHEKGFDGMLISDHDSYDGYRYWRKNIRGKKYKDFVVLKGVEYDTVDGGHFLVILPNHIGLKILEIKGMPVHLLIRLVHHYGGILGPAHPCGERYLSLFSTGKYKRKQDIALQFDFLEGFNACEDERSNAGAREMAAKYRLPMFGGSDSHRPDCVGCAYTEFDADIRDENDLISYIRNGGRTTIGGTRYFGTTKDKLGVFNHLLVQSFWFYNKTGAMIRGRKRRVELEKDKLRKMRESRTKKNSVSSKDKDSQN